MLDAPVPLGPSRVRVEASAGLAVAVAGSVDSSSDQVAELLRQADVAMEQAKRTGVALVRHELGVVAPDLGWLMLGGEIPRAVADREFTVAFQPIVDLVTGDMVAAEALARWHHPDRGELDPQRFLTAVERSGLLPAFAAAVLDQALSAVRRWTELGVEATVAVNASPRSLLDATFGQLVLGRLAAHGVAAQSLVLELTESLTLNQVDLVGGVLAELRDAGVRLALDDFGTGYSSLSLLARVPAYELKIDRSFVSAMRTSPEAAAVVRSTIELGRSLGRLVVAEGVETDEECQLLTDLGCHCGQGHLFARPLPIDELIARLAQGTDGVIGRLYRPRPAPAAVEVVRPRRSTEDDQPSHSHEENG